MRMQGYCDVYKWTILKRTSPEVKCLHPTSSRREMCTSSVSNVIYHKFSHGAAFYTLNGKNVNVMLEYQTRLFKLCYKMKDCCCCCVVALRPRKTSKVMSGRSNNLTTLFLSRLSLVVSLMASFVLSFFPLDVLDEIWDLIESVSEGFLTYS